MRTRSVTPRASAPLEAAHLEEVARDRLRLAALFGAESGPGAGRVDEGQYGHVELLRELHETQRLAIPLGVRHPEVAPEILLRVPPALVADDHHRLTIESRPAPDDGCVLAIETIAVQLDEVGEDRPEIIVGEGTLVGASDLHPLQRREVPVDLLAQLRDATLQGSDFLRDVKLALVGELLQLVDLLFQLENRLFEVQGGSRHCYLF
jgi:hypothetical protein